MGGRQDIKADVCIVGAGIVGLAHAFAARALGLTVIVLERHTRAVGASVRNFGHGCLAAMADGEPLECALVSRQRWFELAGPAGLEVTAEGTVVVARHPDELRVMENLCRDERRGAEMVTASEVAKLVPIPTDGLVGGLHARLDYRVNPREAVARLAALLERDPHCEIVWQAPVHDVRPGEVHTERAIVSAEHVILCPGPGWHTLPPSVRPQRSDLTLCKLQMIRASAPRRARYAPALMTGLSLLRYPGYTEARGADEVQARIAAEAPELVKAGIHLIVTQLPDGDLIIGDSHEYGDPVSPFNDEGVFQMLLEEASRLLGASELEVRQRWGGVYPVAPGDPFLVENPLPGVHLVEVVSGIGMTTALGLADRVVNRLVPGDSRAAPELSARGA